ncbi:nucleotide exchange factor GrpE [Oenococcus oeni]|uniref:nucleotide exchange factor GrpE n=1 Tax=Oenococcus oeni TaxID=1247 RepID=UPI00050E0A87|nr:nucleotide exchange factor GrpE [Oenococcus oeni]KGH98952.1 molecular chaperone GrpE [Oenococcus oeni IOEB_1491]KGI05229.1 molecular chaperone GrpE [Oenococcus oeni S19]OIL72646.1 nucleotide exchange factor GrpE [Oenococcus oeni]OIM04684.1 nucleotide exchange factor GrpE [Oenococcus oeni]
MVEKKKSQAEKNNQSATEEEIEKAVKGSKRDSNVADEKNSASAAASSSAVSDAEPAVDYEDKFYRAEAEMQNMQQRFNKERASILKYEGQDLAKSILPALDNLERALSVSADDPASKKIQDGVELTYKSLSNALTDNGIVKIGRAGDQFDPNLHNAIQKTPIDDPEKQKEDTIAVVLQKGYQLHDRVLRPAMVSVYTK